MPCFEYIPFKISARYSRRIVISSCVQGLELMGDIQQLEAFSTEGIHKERSKKEKG